MSRHGMMCRTVGLGDVYKKSKEQVYVAKPKLPLLPNSSILYCVILLTHQKNCKSYADKLHEWLRLTSYKYLGLVLNENLACNLHTDQIMKTTRTTRTYISNGRFIPINQRRTIYHAYVQSHLNFILPIYSQVTVTKIHQLEVLHNRCIKAFYGLRRNTASTHLYSSSLSPVVLMAKVERMRQIHKIQLQACNQMRSFTDGSFCILMSCIYLMISQYSLSQLSITTVLMKSFIY